MIRTGFSLHSLWNRAPVLMSETARIVPRYIWHLSTTGMICWKKYFCAEITASDISEDALTLAKENAELNGASVQFIQSDLFEKLEGEYDIVVSNPPYIPTATVQTLQREVRDFEPHLALDGGEDGLDIYRKIARQAAAHIRAGGTLVMEVGEGEATDVAKLFPQKSMIAKDFNGVDRYVKVRMPLPQHTARRSRRRCPDGRAVCSKGLL